MDNLKCGLSTSGFYPPIPTVKNQDIRTIAAESAASSNCHFFGIGCVILLAASIPKKQPIIPPEKCAVRSAFFPTPRKASKANTPARGIHAFFLKIGCFLLKANRHAPRRPAAPNMAVEAPME